MNKPLITYLLEVEGSKVHRLKNEPDITTMCGISRVAHPDALIFKVIDSLARDIHITKDSNKWTESDLDHLNTHIVKTNSTKRLLELVDEFYTTYNKGARLHLFPKECIVTMFSLYTNSPKYSWKSVQDAINAMYTLNKIELPKKLVSDGIFGRNTSKGLKKITELCNDNNEIGQLFELLILSNMSRYYAILVAKNPDKYLPYLIGWNNRLQRLSNS